MFQLRKKRKDSSMEQEVFNNLIDTHAALSNDFAEMKELQTEAAKDREIIIEELKKLNASLEKLSI